MQVKTQKVQNEQHWCFQHITLSFHTYLFISIHDKTILIFMPSLTCPTMPIDNVNTQTIFMVLFTSRSLLTWGETLRCLIQCLPQVFVHHLLSINYLPLLLQTSHHDRLCLLLPGVRQVREGPCSTVGESYHLSPLAAISPTIHNSLGAVLPDEPQGLGEKQKVCQDIAYLVVLAEGEAT